MPKGHILVIKMTRLFLVVVAALFSAAQGFLVMPRVSTTRGTLGRGRLSMAGKWKVTIQHGGKDTVVEVKEDCSILDAAKSAGVDLPYDCEMGVCLTCPAKVVSGKVDSTGTTLDDSVVEAGYALTCTTYPRSDLVIKSIEEDELINVQFEGNMAKSAKK